ncbi:hypothetical protein N9R95_01685, partial [Flavobacteriaceae bacterium]|nr:hypothetical protein [Flavobacteriaceae bacterium]
NSNEEPAVTVKNGKVSVEEDYEGYNLKKKPREDRYYIWSKAIIDNVELLENLNEFLQEDGNDDSDLNEFFDYLGLPQTPYDVINHFKHTNYDEGIGREIGVDDICWTAEVYVRQADVELYSDN